MCVLKQKMKCMKLMLVMIYSDYMLRRLLLRPRMADAVMWFSCSRDPGRQGKTCLASKIHHFMTISLKVLAFHTFHEIHLGYCRMDTLQFQCLAV